MDLGPGLALLEEQNFGSALDEVALGILQAANSDLVISGEQGASALLMAIDTDLQVGWETTFDVMGTDLASLSAVSEAADGDFVAAGFTLLDRTPPMAGPSIQIDIELYAVRTDASGDLIWARTYGVGSALDAGRIDIVATTDGNFLIVGATEGTTGLAAGNNGGIDVIAVMIDPDGEVLWSNVYGGSGTDFVAEVIEESDTNFLIVGTSNSNDGDVTNASGATQTWLLRIDAMGNLLDQQTLVSQGSSSGDSIASLPNGNYAVASSVRGDPLDFSNRDIEVAIVDSDLFELSVEGFGGPGFDDAMQLIPASNGEFFLVGNSSDVGGDVTENQGDLDYWVLKLNSDFELLDELSLGSSSSDFALGGALVSDDEILVAGSVDTADGDVSEVNGGDDIWIARVFDNGPGGMAP